VQTLHKRLQKGEYVLHYQLTRLGDDYSLVVGGGEEHVGSIVLALPRPSLADPARASTTLSVLNVTGHKDDGVAMPLAEALCLISGRPAVVVAGIHFDNLPVAGLKTILSLNEEACRQLPHWVEELAGADSK
jgi:hypothetical protein